MMVAHHILKDQSDSLNFTNLLDIYFLIKIYPVIGTPMKVLKSVPYDISE
jgi:hypothetical protein